MLLTGQNYLKTLKQKKMVEIKLTFTCEKCGREKTTHKKMNYKKFEEKISEGDYQYLPNGWAYSEVSKNKYFIECTSCHEKWLKKNKFIVN